MKFTPVVVTDDEGNRHVVQEQVAEPEPAPPAPPSTEELADRYRVRRNRTLAMTDWTQLADAPMTAEQKQAWAGFRQALRDVPQQEGWPQNASWPAAPDEGLNDE